MAQVGWLTAHLTYYSYHAPDKVPAFEDLTGRNNQAAKREPTPREVRDEALSVVATLNAMNMVANRRQKRSAETGQPPAAA